MGGFSVSCASLKKFPTSWLAKCCLVLLFRQPTSLYRSTVYGHTRSNMHAVSVWLCNPPKYDTDNRIFKVPTGSFNACIYTCVCLYLLCKTEWLPFSWRVAGAWGPFFIREGPWAPFHEILEETLNLSLHSEFNFYFLISNPSHLPHPPVPNTLSQQPFV